MKDFRSLCNKVAREIPEGWTIRIELEHSAGSVWVEGPDDTEWCCSGNDDIEVDVLSALEHAIEAENR